PHPPFHDSFPSRRPSDLSMIFRSPYPDITVPDVPLHHLVLQRATGLGDKPALIDGPSGRTLTYGQLARGVERVAAALGARGFGTDRKSTRLNSSHEWISY